METEGFYSSFIHHPGCSWLVFSPPPALPFRASQVGYTLIGHSERRSKYGETDEDRSPELCSGSEVSRALERGGTLLLNWCVTKELSALTHGPLGYVKIL